MLKLIIEDDQNQVKVVRLLRDDITIGRKEGNTIRLTERNVSRNHARLTKKDDGNIIIEDLNSYNGVKVNNKKITKPAKIEEGDPVLIGDYKILLKIEDKKNKPDPFEEMATIPVDRVEEDELESDQEPPVQKKSETIKTSQQVTQKVKSPLKIEKSEDVPEKTSEKPTEPITNQEDDSEIIPKDKQGAFVVLTSSYSGSRYNFTKTPFILGRNPEADVFIDNQSLSSLHAEISFDGNTYTIKDLGSKNGIRINGEKYEKMTLRKGDIVDLGHVRFRFVAPGEHYQFSKQETTDFESKNNTKLIVISIFLVILFGAGAFYVANNFFGKSKSSDSATKTAKTDSADFEKLDKKLSKFKQEKKWKQLIALANKSSSSSSFKKDQLDKISQYKKLADNELENQKFLQDSKNFVKNQDWTKAYKLAGKISPDSVYKNDKQKVVNQIHAGFFKKAVNDSKKAVKDKKCNIISGYVTQSTSLQLNPDKTSQLQKLAKTCNSKSNQKDSHDKHMSADSSTSKKVNNRSGSTSSGSSRSSSGSSRTSSGSSSSSSKKKNTKKETSSSSSNDSTSKISASTLLTQAKQAYMAGNCSRAVKKAKQAYRMNSSSKAARYVGLCGCKQKRRSWAKWAISRSSGGTRKLIYKFCKKNGLSL